MKIMESSNIAKFYDDFSDKQIKTGTNVRHRFIIKELKKIGLNKNSSVFEIGCGIGTLTKLISKIAYKNKIVGVDISSKSISIAKQNNNPNNNIEYLVSDMSDFSYARKFDFIVLADILEHIPIELHSNIFKIIQKHTHADSLVVINIPHPDSIDWVRNHNPELLQIIDQALNAAELMHTIYSNNLCLVSFKSYSLFFKNYDYQFMVVKPRLSLKSHPIKSKFELLFEQLKYRILI